MLRVLEASSGALNIAGSLCGVPFVGAAAVVVDEIVHTCDEVKLHKRKAKQLSSKCLQILNAFNDRTSDLEGSEMQQLADQLDPILNKVLSRTKRWSNYGSVMTFLRNSEIKEGLDKCDAELDTAMNLFQINSNITLHATQREMLAKMRSDTAEVRELLLRVLTVPSERQQIVELQEQGQHAAEEIMAAGQHELLLLRQEDESNDDETVVPRTSSPPPIKNSQQYLQYQRGLINLHRETGIPPTIKILNGEVTRNSEFAVAGGTYSDIWVGEWLGSEKVALKALRNTRASDPRAKKRFENEIKMWADLKNDHILAFYGIVTDLSHHIHMVSPWQDNGNVLEYVKVHNEANRLHLMSGAAQGLEYLHSCKIIHGNVKCANILVSSKGEACICDFGMSKVMEEVTEKSASATLTSGGSARWLAPELIEGKSPSKAADTYSFAMAILELLTGKHPFADCKRDAQVIHSIVVLKKTPTRPEEAAAYTWLSDDLWDLMQRCWHKDASSRPLMAEVSASIINIELKT